jgi:hypothetical protein
MIKDVRRPLSADVAATASGIDPPLEFDDPRRI